MGIIPLHVQFIKVHPNATLPTKATEGSAGFDLYAAESVTLSGFGKDPWGHPTYPRVAMVRTGLKIALPEGYEAQVRPRSGLALKHGVTVVNSPGTIDPDYRGELCVLLQKLGEGTLVIQPGERIAQLVIQPVQVAVRMVEVAEFSDTGRGEGGFGSTGA